MISNNRAIWLSLVLVAMVVMAAVYFNTDISNIRTKILPNYGSKIGETDRDKGNHKLMEKLKEKEDDLKKRGAKLRAEKRKFEEEKAEVAALKDALDQQRGLLDEEKNRIAQDRLKLQKEIEDMEHRKWLMKDQSQVVLPSVDTSSDEPWLGMTRAEIIDRYPEIIPMANYKLRPFINPSDTTGLEHSPVSIDDMTGAEAENRFYSLINMEHVSCTNTQRLGNFQDGGWDMCISPPYKPKQNDCLIYSFGINNDWSFDDAISRQYGCHVKSFDPSMQVGDHAHSSKVFFYHMGIGEFDKVDEHGWKVNSLKTIIHMLGHDNDIIDYLKMDIEYNEWASFRSMINDNSLRNIKQFAFEIHTSELKVVNHQSTSQEFLSWYKELLALEKLGFRRFHHHRNPLGNFYSSRTKKERTCCCELYYININFLKS